MTTSGTYGEGRRQLRARSCPELVATAAIVLSLALDSERLYDDNERPSSPAVPRAQTTPPPATPATQRGDAENPAFLQQPDRSLPTWRATAEPQSRDLSLRLAMSTEIGTLPRPAIGLGVAAVARAGAYHLSVLLTQWARQVQRSDNSPRAWGGTFDLLSGGLELCRELSRSAAVFGTCLQISVARMSAEGIVDQPKAAVTLLASGGAGGYYERSLGRARVRLGTAILGQWVRPRYTVRVHADSSDPQPSLVLVHQPSPISLRVSLSWGLWF